MNLPDLATKLAEKEYLTQRDAETAVILIFRLFSDAMRGIQETRGSPPSVPQGNTRSYILSGVTLFFLIPH